MQRVTRFSVKYENSCSWHNRKVHIIFVFETNTDKLWSMLFLLPVVHFFIWLVSRAKSIILFAIKNGVFFLSLKSWHWHHLFSEDIYAILFKNYRYVHRFGGGKDFLLEGEINSLPSQIPAFTVDVAFISYISFLLLASNVALVSLFSRRKKAFVEDWRRGWRNQNDINIS